MTLKPFASAMLYHRRRPDRTNSGTAMYRRFRIGPWSRWRKSAMIRRALRKAVSPLVMGAATTPSRARMPPSTPSQLCETFVTTTGAAAVRSEPTSAAPPSKKK